ncbi:MAG: hypothetical protein JNM56_11615 [Planctomycetia bacterium]|nr:hypothetical protein [Planctomycetia bacterium]
MRWCLIAFALGLCALGTGCETPVGSGFEIARYSTRNLLQTPVTASDDRLERHWQRQQAEKAWQSFCQAHPGQLYTVHYQRGFEDGFADYLYAGGAGQPPPVPPWSLRTASYETPTGHQAVEEWFAGFRHGAAAARDSGLRELVLVPSSGVSVARRSVAVPRSTGSTTPTLESLPAPRELPADGPSAATRSPQSQQRHLTPVSHKPVGP